MKSKFCFIRDLGQLRPGSVVYHVSVGTSQRELVKFSLVHEYCQDVGLYFRRWSDEVDKVLVLAANGWSSQWLPCHDPFKHVSVSIETLYQLIIDDSFEAFERNLPITKQELWLFHQFDPQEIIRKSTPVSNTSCPPLQRQNLSSRRKEIASKFLVGSLVILIICAADVIVKKVLLAICGCY